MEREGWRWKDLIKSESSLDSQWLTSARAGLTTSDRLSLRLSRKVALRSTPGLIEDADPRKSWTSNGGYDRLDKAVSLDPVSQPRTAAHAGPQKVPVILVHGFGGWGRHEMGGQFFYWGGFQDTAQKLMEADPELVVLTATVGPFSSVWDRAVELFYQIKGGTVDYGAAHAREFGHERFGSQCDGLYPEWDGDHPVHLIGHSMGGLTARALVHLLHDNGASRGEEALFSSGVGGSALSAKWVQSVTTISAPHDGSPAADKAAAMHNIVFSTMAMSLGLLGAVNADVVYDFKLHQWGVAPRGRLESWPEYYNRVTTARVFTDKTKSWQDFSEYDLTLDGAAELNSWVHDHPEVYYMSYESCCTYKSPLALSQEATHLPVFSTRAIFLPSSFLLGHGVQLPAWSRDMHVTKADWRPNDGMVPCCSQRGPSFRREWSTRGHGRGPAAEEGEYRVVRTSSVVVDHAGAGCAGLAGQRGNKCRVDGKTLRPGVWNYFGRLDELDHLACIGWTDKTVWDFTAFMQGHLAILRALPHHSHVRFSSGTATRSSDSQHRQHAEGMVSALRSGRFAPQRPSSVLRQSEADRLFA